MMDQRCLFLSRIRRDRTLAAKIRLLDIADSPALEDHHCLLSTRGELLRRLGRTDEARDAYRRVLTLVHDDAEGAFSSAGWRLSADYGATVK
jgi:predicted RNA polymerase sigma factor